MNRNTITEMATAAIHGVQENIAEHAHLVPIYATSTFTFDSAQQGMDRFSGKEQGFIYSRFGNPTTSAAAQLVAALETHGLKTATGEPMEAHAFLTSSGQAALATMLMSLVKAGDTIISDHVLYGGTYEFLNNFLPAFGVRTVFINITDLNALEQALKNDPSVRLIHIETPANPLMQCTDMEAVCRIAQKHGVIVTIDNTFATPYLQQPFRYGVDYIFHSTTKFLNGHGSAIGGVIVGRHINFMRTQMAKTHKLLGGNSNPFDAFMLMQGIKTLAVRMDRHCSNAEQVADYLSAHPAVAKVNYNGLASHPDYAISKKQMRAAGAVLSFELKGGFDQSVHFINKLQLCVRAVSLGTVDTLISHPASMSHSGMSKEEREKAGISDGLIRMSVGLEDINDILNDLGQALN
ncbi:MAG: aminotransferase class I/II-fold pyridoxal phosphate-dependent enzyme [Niabella sp.]